MGRVSQAQARENRQRVVRAVAELFRERGAQVSVVDLMKEVGLTHGGFYKHFDSKEALFEEAMALAFQEAAAQEYRQPAAEGGLSEQAIAAYLSVEHRDAVAEGCPVAALATDVARGHGGSTAQVQYSDGVAQLARLLATDEDDDGLSRMCTMVGALVLARATRDTELSGAILTAARTALNTSG
ncbi:TetR/AcrR family transcriptional regulator [Streptomyces chartreusis]|uniref:TetR/AcrR family transcriptional regulator n=1 Tax=Streptomyces chartreusis TaxID=1969 RepID=UPI003632403E